MRCSHQVLPALILTVSCCLLFGTHAAHAQTERTHAVSEHAVVRQHNPIFERVAAEFGLAVLTMVVPSVIGYGIGYAASSGERSTSCPSCTLGRQETGLAVGGIGAFIGVALMPSAISLAGSAVGGRGDASGAYLGFVIGTAALGLLGLAAWAISDVGETAAYLLLTAAPLPIVGAIVGYELMDHHARIAVAPSISIHPTGGSVSVSGTF